MKLVLAAVAALALTALPALADPTPDRRFGGCSPTGNFCAGPTANLSLVGMNLKSGEFIAGIIPGAGYGVTFMANKWYQTGLGGYASVQVGQAQTSGLFSLVASFAEYLRIGVGYQVTGPSHAPILLMGLGMDFGSTGQ